MICLCVSQAQCKAQRKIHMEYPKLKVRLKKKISHGRKCRRHLARTSKYSDQLTNMLKSTIHGL